MSEQPRPHQLPALDKKVAYCVSLVEEKKAEEVLVFDLRDISSVTDYFLLCHGSSGRQVQAIADHLLEMAKKRGLRPLGVEGYPAAQWVLLDLGDLIVHVFYEETRRFYDLERLWGHAPQIYPPHAKALT
jgi:ribosome-associated protein